MPARALFMLAVFVVLAPAQTDPSARIDEIFKTWNKIESPGAAVAVVHEGKLVFQRGYGAANLEYDVPIKAETVFHVASVSKQFTAMAIVLLEQEDKLSLEDDIRKHLPELPDYGRKITIRQLLQHTSGIRDQWQTLGIAGWRLDDVITQRQILNLMFRQRELNFEPGTRHLYSNGGYTLAAEIVARASGKHMPDFCDERIFKPLGMTRTHFHIDHQRIVRDRAYSYEPYGGGFRATPLNYSNVGATSLFTTAPDLTKWLDNFRDPKVGGAKAIARLQEQAVLANGEKIPYALGVGIGSYRGLTTVAHSGGDAGYRSYVAWYPERQLGIAVVSNLGSFNPANTANQVAAVYLGDKMTPESPKPESVKRTFVTLEPAQVAPYAGHYRLADLLLHVVPKEGKLMAAPVGAMLVELKPLSPTRFYNEAMQAELEFTPAAKDMRVRLTRLGGNVSGERIVYSPYDPNDEDQYLGAWWSDELETQYTIRRKEDRLFIDHVHHGEVSLTPVAKDQLRAATWFMPEVKFARDAAGRISAMTLGGGRLTGIRFVRRLQ